MTVYPVYPASVSNQITEEYYFVLIGQINRGTCSLRVVKLLRRNGRYSYHLISVA
jgi:hypothetical protein